MEPNNSQQPQPIPAVPTDFPAGRNPGHQTPGSYFLSPQQEHTVQQPQQTGPVPAANRPQKTTPDNPLLGMLGGFGLLFSKKKPAAGKGMSSRTVIPGTASPKDQQTESPTAEIEMTLKDIIAPPAIEVDFNHIQIGERYYRTLFASGYPRFVGPNWLSPLINFEHSLSISTFYYPVDSKEVLQKLKRKISEMEASLYTDAEKGKVLDPTMKITLSDAHKLQDSIAEGTQKFFHFAMYITLNADTKELLDKITKNLISTLAAINVVAKPATLQMEPAFLSSMPTGSDHLYITRNMDTTSLATTFPFVSSELTMDHGVMYGINMHNKSLIIFDRFELENANSVIFAKAGAGKSYFVKLEALRSLMLGSDIIIIDPEREFERLCNSVNGAYITFSQDQGSKINPFELSGLGSEDEDELRMKILALHGFFKVMFGGVTNVESSILDRALILTYRERGITTDPDTQKGKEPPLLEDLYKILQGMPDPEARGLSSRLEKFVIGSGAGVFNEKSNVSITNPFTVFSLRDLQEELRPMAMYLMLDFIWTKIKKDQRKRLLIVDEAWLMMQNEDSAKFIYSIAKRARKYHLGLTTVTQDVEDFMKSDYGKAIITNSSIQVLLKQSTAAIDYIQAVFNLSEGERHFLLACDKGEGIFFAGANHVAIKIISSIGEHLLITSDPREVELMKKTGINIDDREISQLAAVFDQYAAQREIQNIEEGSATNSSLDQQPAT
jgi:conjugal transfer ATP-binding protein TraC